MPRFLIFTLCGPFASWGTVAPGERRGSDAHPTRSAVLGLVAAALGIDKRDGAAHATLEDGFGYAVRVAAAGRPLRDYHTVQSAPARRNRTFATRRDELAVDDLYTIVSQRDYYTDALYDCALWERGRPSRALDDLSAALTRPHFVLYLGRKACPPALPLDPAIIEAHTLPAALAERARRNAERLEAIGLHASLAALRNGGEARLYFDLDAPGIDPHEVTQIRRRDAVLDRPRWQFAERAEGWIDDAGIADGVGS